LSFILAIVRFWITAIVVSLAIFAGFAAFASLTEQHAPFDGAVVVGFFAFPFALAGGLFVGVPLLMLARKFEIARDPLKLSGIGAIGGALTAPIICTIFWLGNGALIIPSLLYWTVPGVFGGAIAGCFWAWSGRYQDRLHRHA